jgi:hypothetical protein
MARSVPPKPKNPSHQPPKPGGNDKDWWKIRCSICGQVFMQQGTDLREHKDQRGFMCYGVGVIVEPVIKP